MSNVSSSSSTSRSLIASTKLKAHPFLLNPSCVLWTSLPSWWLKHIELDVALIKLPCTINNPIKLTLSSSTFVPSSLSLSGSSMSSLRPPLLLSNSIWMLCSLTNQKFPNQLNLINNGFLVSKTFQCLLKMANHPPKKVQKEIRSLTPNGHTTNS